MDNLLEKLPAYVERLKAIKETIITNIVLIGQKPSPTFKEKARIKAFMERLSEFQVDECTTDGYRNPIGIIRGQSPTKPPIFLIAHLDSLFDKDIDHNYVVKKSTITGAGIMDNAIGVGVLVSLPEIFRHLELEFESDIVLAGVIQSMGKGNLRGIRHLLKTWATPIRGAICIEGGFLGRLSYYSQGMIRGEIECNLAHRTSWDRKFKPNAILILNEVINQILELRLPQKPRARIVIGKIGGGFKHGLIANNATLGFEIQSDSDQMVKTIYNDTKDIITGVGHEYGVDMKLKTISNASAARLKYNHPLVKGSAEIMKKLGLNPTSEPSVSELSIFLSRQIPAVTIGITTGDNIQQEDAVMEIEPMFTGIAQLVGIVEAIDSGICDEERMA